MSLPVHGLTVQPEGLAAAHRSPETQPPGGPFLGTRALEASAGRRQFDETPARSSSTDPEELSEESFESRSWLMS